MPGRGFLEGHQPGREFAELLAQAKYLAEMGIPPTGFENRDARAIGAGQQPAGGLRQYFVLAARTSGGGPTVHHAGGDILRLTRLAQGVRQHRIALVNVGQSGQKIVVGLRQVGRRPGLHPGIAAHDQGH